MEENSVPVEALGQVEVFNENDETIRLSDLWEKTVSVLVFVRHFG